MLTNVSSKEIDTTLKKTKQTKIFGI